MKKVLCTVLAVVMAVACFAGCSAPAAEGGNTAASGDTIKVGLLGPYTGKLAVYGLAVKNGATLYFDKVNAEGGINGKKVELISYDNKGDDAEAINAFNREVDEGITALIGDVITSNTIAVAGEANAVNMPMITASATDEAVTVNPDDGSVYTNVFRTCFIDPFQGEKMAQYAKEKLGYTKAAVIVQTGNDYAVGLNEAFKAKCAELGITVVAEEGYATGD